MTGNMLAGQEIFENSKLNHISSNKGAQNDDKIDSNKIKNKTEKQQLKHKKK